MTEKHPFSFVKPGLNTTYHIDFDWWKNHDANWRVFLIGYLCPEHQAAFSETDNEIMIDWVDPETAEIYKVDGLQSTLMNHCAKIEGFYTGQTALVDALFRVFLANGNTPLSPLELSDKIGRPAETILRTISSPNVYKGIRPCR
jgi:hypothetical protein